MPGRDKLARELGVHGSTVERALQLLEEEGLLEKSGPGKSRAIVASATPAHTSATVCVLMYNKEDVTDDHILILQYHITAAGHNIAFAPRTMRDLKFDPDRVEAMVAKQSADAWIVYAGSKPVLERFVRMSVPVFAFLGRMRGLPIGGCGTDILPALREAVHWLYELGHRRIVMLTRAQIVEAGLGAVERTFVQELQKKNVPVGAYNLPVWDNTPAGLKNCLDKLFQVSPPTAILVDDWMNYNSIQHYLFYGLGVAPRTVSCVCMDYHPSLSLYQPQALYFYWDPNAAVRAAVAWVKSVGRGRISVAQKTIEAEFRGRELPTKLD